MTRRHADLRRGVGAKTVARNIPREGCPLSFSATQPGPRPRAGASVRPSPGVGNRAGAATRFIRHPPARVRLLRHRRRRVASSWLPRMAALLSEVRQQYRLQGSGELKGKTLLKAPRGREALRDILQKLRTERIPLSVLAVHKPFVLLVSSSRTVPTPCTTRSSANAGHGTRGSRSH